MLGSAGSLCTALAAAFKNVVVARKGKAPVERPGLVGYGPPHQLEACLYPDVVSESSEKAKYLVQLLVHL